MVGALALAALGIVAVASRVAAFQNDDLVADDFTQDFVSAEAWAAGEDPYGLQRVQGPRLIDAPISVDSLRREHRNPHAPAQFLLLAPLTALPYRAARTIWLLLTTGLTTVALFALARGFGWSRGAAWTLGLAALALPVVQSDLLYGQIGGPLLALLVLAWRDVKAGREVRAGVAIGLAAAIKLFPAFLIIPLIRRRQWRGIGFLCATAAVVTGGSMAIVGWTATSSWLNVAAPENFRFWRGAPVNISLPGTAFRWLTEGPWRGGVPDRAALATAIAIALMAVCAVCAYTTAARSSRDVFIAALPWMLLAGPLTGDLSLTIVMPFLFAVTVTAFAEEGAARRIFVIVAAAILMIGTPPGLPGPRADLSVLTVVAGYGLPTLALLALAVADTNSRRSTLHPPRIRETSSDGAV